MVKSNSAKNGSVSPGAGLPPEVIDKIANLHMQVRESFGKIVMALMQLPRYRNLPLGELQSLVLEPLIRDRLAIAHPNIKEGENPELTDLVGFAVWASVSDEVDAKIREQIKAGVWPIRLKPEDWASGKINWFFDVIAPDRKVTAQVIANFKQLVKEGDLRLHPLVAKLVEPDVLEKMGAQRTAPGVRPN